MINRLFYYISESFDPYINLAIEKWLFDNVSKDSVILYLWQNKNTVVIGRNQNPWCECNLPLLEAEDGLLARRLSGGGAVYHDLGNLNFTFICPQENYDLVRQQNVIISALSKVGINAEISGRNDILIDGKKFSGNAFYNSKGTSYHHGTILISADKDKLSRYLTPPKAKLEAKGIKSVRSRVINLCEILPNLTLDEMKKNLLFAFENVYNLSPIPYDNPNQKEISDTARKYGSWEFLYGKSLPFTYTSENQFSWGYAALNLNVKDGIINDVALYTDSLLWEVPEIVKKLLIGCKFSITEIESALKTNIPTEISNDLLTLLKNNL